MRFKIALLSVLWAAPAAFAADRYLDDRSTPEQLIRSLYSAINLQQYSRAYTYFSNPPAKDYETYAKGFEDTARVDVLIGEITGEGAAGHTYSNVPVAIRAHDKANKESYFAGCYVVSQTNADQDPPYTPLQIQSAKLKPVKEEDFDRQSLPKCGDIPADEETSAPTLDDAKAKFASDTQGECDKAADTLADLNDPEMHEITFKRESDQNPEKATVYLFSCQMAAYNEFTVVYLVTQDEGLRRVSFAEPRFKIDYKDEENAKIKSMVLEGFVSTSGLTNAEFDSKTNTLSEFNKARGVADASSSGEWVFINGEFVLKTYDEDATYDGKVNPIPVIRDGKWVFKP